MTGTGTSTGRLCDIQTLNTQQHMHSFNQGKTIGTIYNPPTRTIKTKDTSLLTHNQNVRLRANYTVKACHSFDH